MEPPTRFERVKEDYKSTILPLELQGRKIKRMAPYATSRQNPVGHTYTLRMVPVRGSNPPSRRSPHAAMILIGDFRTAPRGVPRMLM